MGKVGCVDCHQAETAMFSGEGVKGIPTAPDPMWGKVSCPECHAGVKRGKREGVAGVKAACVRCHDKKYASFVDDWVAMNAKLRQKYSASLSGFEKELSAVEKQEGRHSVPLRATYDEIETDVAFILKGGWQHNPEYGEAVAARIEKDSSALESMIKAKKEGREIFPRR